MDEHKHYLEPLFPVLIGLLVGVIRLLHERRTKVFEWFTGLVLAGVFAYLTHLYLQDYKDLSEGSRAVIIGLSSLLSHDILKGLLTIGRQLREDPLAVINFLRTSKWQETTKKSTESTTPSQNRRSEEHKETKPDA